MKRHLLVHICINEHFFPATFICSIKQSDVSMNMVNNAAGVMFMRSYRGMHAFYFVQPMQKKTHHFK